MTALLALTQLARLGFVCTHFDGALFWLRLWDSERRQRLMAEVLDSDVERGLPRLHSAWVAAHGFRPGQTAIRCENCQRVYSAEAFAGLTLVLEAHGTQTRQCECNSTVTLEAHRGS